MRKNHERTTEKVNLGIPTGRQLVYLGKDRLGKVRIKKYIVTYALKQLDDDERSMFNIRRKLRYRFGPH